MKYALLETTFAILKESDPRNAAEHAYALAVLYQRQGNLDEAVRFGREAITLLGQCPTDTLNECAARNTILEGVAIPDILHEAVIRDRLQSLAL